jgi:hypothetical protein
MDGKKRVNGQRSTVKRGAKGAKGVELTGDLYRKE